MNYIKETEDRLRYYRDLCRSAENIDRRIAELIQKAGPHSLTAIAMDDTGIHGGGHDATINVLFEIQRLTEFKRETMEVLNKILGLLDEISQEEGCELYGPILRMWYIERRPKEDIAEVLKYSSRQSVYDLKNKAIRKFAIRLYGIEALKAV